MVHDDSQRLHWPEYGSYLSVAGLKPGRCTVGYPVSCSIGPLLVWFALLTSTAVRLSALDSKPELSRGLLEEEPMLMSGGPETRYINYELNTKYF